MANRYFPKTISYTTAIPFNEPVTYLGEHEISAPTTFTVNSTDAQVMYGSFLRLVADGTNTPDFSAFEVIAGSWNNEAGALNRVAFLFDGVDYCVAFTGGGTSGGGGEGDVTAPTVVSRVIQDATPTKLRITYNEPLLTSSVPSNSHFILNEGSAGSGFTGTPVVSGSYVELTLSTPAAFGDAFDLGYTGSVIKDLAGNSAGTYATQTVTNNVAGSGLVALDFPTETNLSEASNVWTGSGTAWDNSGLSDSVAPASTDVGYSMKGDSLYGFIGFSTSNTEPNGGASDPTNVNAGFYLSAPAFFYKKEGAGAFAGPTSLGVTLTGADSVRLFRNGTTGACKIQYDIGSVGTWVDAPTSGSFTFSSTAQLYLVCKIYNTAGAKLVEPEGENVI